MENIAADAGLTGAAIYNHFKSKDALFLATTIHMTRTNLVAIKQAVQGANDWRSGFSAMLSLYKNDATGWFCYPLLTSATQLKMLRNRDQFSEMLDLRREYITQFEHLVSQAIEAGDLPDHISRSLAGELLMGFIFNGMGSAIGHRRSEEEIAQIVDTVEVLLTFPRHS